MSKLNLSRVHPETEENNTNTHKPMELSEEERVFGTRPYAPRAIVPDVNGQNLVSSPDVHMIENERNHDRAPLTNNDHLSGIVAEIFSQPLLEPEKPRPTPPLAGPEVDDLDDDVKTPSNASTHGIDDGLLEPVDKDTPNGHGGNENDDHDDDDFDDRHVLGGHDTDDGKLPNGVDEPDIHDGLMPRFGGDDRGMSPFPGSIPDVNTYQQKKNLAQGMMDLALLTANANQLRYVADYNSTHPYYYISLVLISLSIIFQIAVGVGLIMNSRYNVKEHKEMCEADRINNFTVLGVFLITVVNVFITAFSVIGTQSSPSTDIQVAGPK